MRFAEQVAVVTGGGSGTQVRSYGVGTRNDEWRNGRYVTAEVLAYNSENSAGDRDLIGAYLASKYGYTSERAAAGRGRVGSILQTLSETLGDKDYFFAGMTALDLYWAAFGNMFMLLAEKDFPAMPMARDAWANVGGGPYADAVPDNLRLHHARMYERHLSLPLEL